MKEVYLYPGQLHASKEPCVITTILGSCVAVALFDTITKIAGLNHYLLPRIPAGEAGNSRYGEYAVEELLNQMLRLGAHRSAIRAKIYGGANVLEDVSVGQKVGEKNVEYAEEILSQLRIPIVERNVGGERGRRIELNTQTFAVEHRFMAERTASADSNKGIKTRPRGETASSHSLAQTSLSNVRLICIGGNSGSQFSLARLLGSFPSDSPPVLISNSTVAGNAQKLIEELRSKCRLQLQLAENNMILNAGTAYICPSHRHMKVQRSGSVFQIQLEEGLPVHEQKPSANILFQSAALCGRSATLAILLGGSGADGVDGLLKIRSSGGTTLVERPENTSFRALPEKAIALSAAEHVLGVEQMSQMIQSLRSGRAA